MKAEREIANGIGTETDQIEQEIVERESARENGRETVKGKGRETGRGTESEESERREEGKEIASGIENPIKKIGTATGTIEREENARGWRGLSRDQNQSKGDHARVTLRENDKGEQEEEMKN